MKRSIVCYDIADERRLSKVAKYLESEGIRIQYSVFLILDMSPQRMDEMCARLSLLINQEVDDVRIYEVIHSGVRLGMALDLDNPFVLL
jgi:CRISPR-associated protein Cas2